MEKVSPHFCFSVNTVSRNTEGWGGPDVSFRARQDVLMKPRLLPAVWLLDALCAHDSFPGRKESDPTEDE